jgi:hypothetical protein
MTKARLHPALLEFNGAMGDMVFKKRGKKVYVSIKSKGKYFKKAINYAKSVMADETTRAFYESRCTDKETNAFALSVGDFLNAPTIDDLDLSGYKGKAGDRILITTFDDVGVINVDVTLTNTDGTTIEKGKAVEVGAGSGEWEYVATAPVALGTDIFIEAEAFDRPGHRTVTSANPIVGANNN